MTPSPLPKAFYPPPNGQVLLHVCFIYIWNLTLITLDCVRLPRIRHAIGEQKDVAAEHKVPRQTERGRVEHLHLVHVGREDLAETKLGRVSIATEVFGIAERRGLGGGFCRNGAIAKYRYTLLKKVNET